MKKFIIQEKFVGYADITIEAETEDEAIALYNRGYYKDSNYDLDDMTYDHEFSDIREEVEDENYSSKVDALVDSMSVTDKEVSTTHRRRDLDTL